MLGLRWGGRHHTRSIYGPIHIGERVGGSGRHYRVDDSFDGWLGQLRNGVAIQHLLALLEYFGQLTKYLKVLRFYSRLAAHRREGRKDGEQEQQGHQQGMRIVRPRRPTD